MRSHICALYIMLHYFSGAAKPMLESFVLLKLLSIIFSDSNLFSYVFFQDPLDVE